MDAYEATRIVFSRIQSLDPKNASKIMGLLLIQDHSEKEMIRLAFGPEALVHSVVLKAHKELGLVPATPSAAATGGPPSSFLLGRQNSSPRHLGGLAVSSTTSWAPPPVFPSSRDVNNVTPGDDIQGSAELVSPSNPAVASPFYGGGELIEESQLQEQLSFLNDPAASSVQVSATNPALGLQICPKGGDFFYPDDAAECRSPSSGGEGMLLPCSIVGGGGWGKNGGHHRRSFSLADAYLGSDAAGAGFGWRPCLYYAKGYCKNGASCRFLHGVPDDTAVATMAAAGGKMDPVIEQQCQELLLRYKSQSLGGASRLMASAFPYSPTGSVPASPSSSIKCINSLLQQQIESQRAAACTAAALMLGSDETQRFTRWSRMERTDLAAMSNRGSWQIYLTFPADSTFREEDVFNYFSIYGPVQDVRIPYQEKRMFGFVTFVYPETVKLILAKGNPHFVCDARVLVKPYKEKGRVPDKYRKQQQAERGDLSGCSTPTSLDSRDPFELSKLGGPRMLYSSSSSSHEAILRRKLEEQQQVAELQQAIELQGRRFMGLQLLDLKTRNQITATATAATTTTISTSAIVTASTDGMIFSNQEEATSQVATGISPGASSAMAEQQQGSSPHGVARQPALDANAAADKEESAEEATPNEDSRLQGSSVEHNLPDSPFASPTKASFAGNSFSNSSSAEADLASASLSQNNKNNHLITSAFFPDSSTHDMASFSSCFFQLPRFSSGHGAVRM